jgi:2-succinyl-6-hydroxy-2,4-cyclohexadiene-1-carboxylate synthase
LSVGLICALHGFLGQGSDWEPVKNLLSDFEWYTPDLFAPGHATDLTFSGAKSSPGKKVFVGYSLGGRIGLSVLKSQPQLFDHYIFVSVNPGFSDSDLASRKQRLQSDSEWADRISAGNWESFLKEWNKQGVFSASSVEPDRKVSDYDIPKLKESLKRWSLGAQPDYSELIKKNKSKITWIVGSKDLKFVALAEQLKQKNAIDSYLKIESGHRIPFDSPKKLSEIIRTVLESHST